MNPEEVPKKKHTLDKIFFGAVIGGAIGSVLGASIAPKKGRETRREIVETVKNTATGSRKLFQKLKEFFSFKKRKVEAAAQHARNTTSREAIKKIPNEAPAEASIDAKGEKQS